jgi:hypothetical protein
LCSTSRSRRRHVVARTCAPRPCRSGNQRLSPPTRLVTCDRRRAMMCVSRRSRVDGSGRACQSRESSLWAFGFAGLGVCGGGNRPSFTERGRPQPVASGGKRPLYHGTSQQPVQPIARIWLVLAASALSRFAVDCHWLQPRGSIKAPSFVAELGYRVVVVARRAAP